MSLLFGLICRLRVCACRCAGYFSPPPFPETGQQFLHMLSAWSNAESIFSPFSNDGFQSWVHRIALGPIIIAQPAQIQPLMEAC